MIIMIIMIVIITMIMMIMMIIMVITIMDTIIHHDDHDLCNISYTITYFISYQSPIKYLPN